MSKEETLEKVTDYIGAEVEASLRDYQFITQLNKSTTTLFKDYSVVAEKISKNVNRINENQMARARLDGLIKSINEIDGKVSKLESMAYKIDSYSKRLEETFKSIETSRSQMTVNNTNISATAPP